MKVLHRYKLTIALISILATAAFLRLYRIADYLTFLGDEGRDVLVVKGILEGNLVFLGPRASSGDFFLGPIYYYMMAPFLWLSGLNPIGPAIMIAVLGVATVYLVYHIGKEFFGTTAGLIAASLYSVSALVVQFSKSSWNPNAVPFFTLLLMYCLYKAVKSGSWKLYLTVGILFGILMQLHYIVVFLGLVIALFIVIGNIVPYMKKEVGKRFLSVFQGAFYTFFGFIIGFSPFLAFEMKNGFPNLRTIFSFVSANTVGGQTSSAPMYWIISDVFLRVFGRLLVVFPSNPVQRTMDPSMLAVWIGLVVLLAVGSIIALFRTKDIVFKIMVLLWITLGIVLFGFYKKPIYDYYFVFLFPVPFLLIGNLLGSLYDLKKFAILGKFVTVITVTSLILLNLMNSHLRTQPNRQLMQMQNISEFVLRKISPGPYNFALITQGNSDHAYRFFFSMHDRDPVIIENEMNDPERKTVTDQLLVICEEVPCSPLGHPLFEVASFGRAEIVGKWDLKISDGALSPAPKGERPFVTVYKLKHYEGK
jgi:4-amino-4-deoxy-L-arabinose transferase-like glycosyltransferase